MQHDEYGLKIRKECTTVGDSRSTLPKEEWILKTPCKDTAWLPYRENEEGRRIVLLPGWRDAPVVLTPGNFLLYECNLAVDHVEHKFYLVCKDGKALLHQYVTQDD